MDPIAADFTNSVALTVNIREIVDELISSLIFSMPEKIPIRHFQAGRRLQGLELVPFCTEALNCHKFMFHSPTSLGICSVMDGEPFLDVVKPSQMTDVLGQFFSLGLDDGASSRTFSEFNSFTIMVNLHNSDIVKAKGFGHLQVSIGSPDSYVNQWRSSLFKPGYQVNVKVKAQVQKSKEDIRSFDISARNCYFEDENPIEDSMFQKYSVDNCVYECSVKQVRTTNNGSQCIPWDLPYMFVPGETKICSGKEAGEFKLKLSQLMQDYKDLCKHCKPSCHSNTFDSNFDAFHLDPSVACRDTKFFNSLKVREVDIHLPYSGAHT